VVKMWCVPVKKALQSGIGACSPPRVLTQIKMALAQHKVGLSLEVGNVATGMCGCVFVCVCVWVGGCVGVGVCVCVCVCERVQRQEKRGLWICENKVGCKVLTLTHDMGGRTHMVCNCQVPL